MYFLARLEETGLSIWLRESDWGFFIALTVHSLSLGLVVGINIAIDLRLLGMARRIPVAMMFRLLPAMWIGLPAIVISGVLLLLAYPAKALTNEVFYLKLLCIAGGLTLLKRFARVLAGSINAGANTASIAVPANIRYLAILSLLLWIGSISTGRFLAYTHSVLLAARFY